MKKVFISYSWDDKYYKEWVLKFSIELRKFDILPILDQTDLILGDPMPFFMEKSIEDSDYVLILCTPSYKKKADKRSGGVGCEDSIITSDILFRQNHRKYITVLVSGTWNISTPVWARGKFGVDFTDETTIQSEFENLIKTICDNYSFVDSQMLPYDNFRSKCVHTRENIHFYGFQEEHEDFSTTSIEFTKPVERDDVINIVTENGKEISLYIITILQSTKDKNKSFLLYTFDENAENVDIYAAQLVLEDGQYTLDSITDPDDWNVVQNAIEELAE